MRGLLVESGVRLQISPAALTTSVAVWGLTFAAIASDRAAARAAAAAGAQASERVRYVQPTLPSKHADLFGGLTYATGTGATAAPLGAGGGRGGHSARPAVRQFAPPPPPDLPAGEGGEVYVESDVDTPVSRDPSSTAPAYPEFLEESSIEGFVIAEYVVDTTGRADSASLHIKFCSHPAFGESLRAALPGMRFVPASRGGQKVRQMVRQEFIFKLGANPLLNRTTM
jgi:protein TonB